MAAEQLIALEAALGELGSLYVAARRFVDLRPGAEEELLPRTARLGATLRAFLRRGQFDAAAVDAAAREIAEVRADWFGRLETVHESARYQRALTAWESADAAALRNSLPQLLAGVAPLTHVPDLFAGVSAAAGRRRPGTRPFLSAAECAKKIADYRDQGLASERGGDQWWDQELTTVQLVDDPRALDTPIALRYAPGTLMLPVFRLDGSAFVHVFCQSLCAPFTVLLQDETDDEWWAAYEESYAAYRDELNAHLEQVGVPVEIAPGP